MRCTVAAFLLTLFAFLSPGRAMAKHARFRVLAFYTTQTEPDHVRFAVDALKFYAGAAKKNNFEFDSTTRWDDLNDAHLATYQVVVWLNDQPSDEAQRRAFQNYIENGGAWLGFHMAGYNDRDTHWPWFVDFLGGSVFYTNNWPPLPARLTIDDREHPVAAHLPAEFISPDNEWYIWKPGPRLNQSVRVLATLAPSNYPIGFKDVIRGGDLPVVWTNTKYKMLYINMGHGDKIFTSPIQNRLFENGVVWLGTLAKPSEIHSRPPEMPGAAGVEISPHAAVVNPKTGKAYAVNSAPGSVTIKDRAGNSAQTVKVGSEPVAIAVNPVTNRIYVGNNGSRTVSVIDGATGMATAEVNVGSLPYVVAVNPATNKVYVSKTFSTTMKVIDGATNATGNLKEGIQADAMAVNPVTNKIYLTNYESPEITVLDGATEAATNVAAEMHLWAVAVNSETNKIYFAGAGSSHLLVLDGATNTITTVETGKIPCAVTVDSASNLVYTANYASDSVTVVNGSDNSVLATIAVGPGPQAIAVNSHTHTIYVANTHGESVTVIDGTKNSVVATVQTGRHPYAIAVDETGNRAYVSDLGSSNLTVIEGREALRDGPGKMGPSPQAFAPRHPL